MGDGRHRLGAARGLVFRPRVGELLLNTGAAGGADGAAVRGPRRRPAPGWSSAPTLRGPRAVWRPLLAAPLAIPAFVNSYAWIGGARPRRTLVRGADRGAVLLPVRLYAGGGDAEPARPGARGIGGAHWARAAARVFFRVVLPQLRLAIARRRAARRAAPAGRVRRVRDDALRHLHDRDHGAVPVDVQRRRRQHAGRRARGPVPAAALAEVPSRGTVRYARVGSGAPRQAAPIAGPLRAAAAAGSRPSLRSPRRPVWSSAAGS